MSAEEVGREANTQEIAALLERLAAFEPVTPVPSEWAEERQAPQVSRSLRGRAGYKPLAVWLDEI